MCLVVLIQFLNGQALKRKGITTPVGFDYDPETISLISWNVEHFVDLHDNPYINHPRENNPEEPMKGREALLVKALKKANADVVVLQEFESIAYLKEIADRELSDMGYQFFADAESFSWYMNVVIMSKVPLGVMYSYGAAYTPVVDYVNDEGERESQININTRMWSIDVLPNEKYEFTLTGVHLKAGRGERNEKMRLGQIALLKNQWARMIKEDKKANLMIVGDFNCTPDSQEFASLLKGKKGNAFIDPLYGTGVFSHPSDAPRWRIDHILYNKNMTNEMMPGDTKVYRDLLEEEEMMQLSDHLPMLTRIKVR
jgi:endonuclease/exonuclease/phosphatase family metal-dependent hydrolase